MGNKSVIMFKLIKMPLLIFIILTIFAFFIGAFFVGWREGSLYSWATDCSRPKTYFQKYFIPYRVGQSIGCNLHKRLDE